MKQSAPRNIHAILGDKLLAEPLMRQALTHRSASALHNERIEFLGDAVLGLLIANSVYSKFPLSDEGELTRLRSYLVKKETLYRIARELDISFLIVIGEGESASGGLQRESLLANTLEAVIGAIYLLQGIDRAQEFIDEIFADTLADIPSIDSLQDAKSKLQEYLQKRGFDRPVYRQLEQSGSNHFKVACIVAELDAQSHGEARSRRKAEQQAAAGVLQQLLEYRDE